MILNATTLNTLIVITHVFKLFNKLLFNDKQNVFPRSVILVQFIYFFTTNQQYSVMR